MLWKGHVAGDSRQALGATGFSQQESRGLSPTATGNRILPAIWESLGVVISLPEPPGKNSLISATWDSEQRIYKTQWGSTSVLFKPQHLLCECVCVCVVSHSVMSYSLWPHRVYEAPLSMAPLSMGFSRQEYWSGLPFSPPEDLPDPGIKPAFPASLALAGRFLTTEPPGKPQCSR